MLDEKYLLEIDDDGGESLEQEDEPGDDQTLSDLFGEDDENED